MKPVKVKKWERSRKLGKFWFVSLWSAFAVLLFSLSEFLGFYFLLRVDSEIILFSLEIVSPILLAFWIVFASYNWDKTETEYRKHLNEQERFKARI